MSPSRLSDQVRHGRAMPHPAVQLCLCVAVLCAIGMETAHATELGRLFFTPQERERMDMQGAVKAEAQSRVDTITVNGMIQKGDGKRVYWINGEPQEAVAAPRKAPASVQITVPGQSRPVELKVGQRIELSAPAAPEE